MILLFGHSSSVKSVASSENSPECEEEGVAYEAVIQAAVRLLCIYFVRQLWKYR